MSKQTLTMSVVGTLLNLLEGHKQRGIISDKYSIEAIKPLAYLAFMMGAIITQLEPQRLQSINKEMTQLHNYDIGQSEDWVKQVEEIREDSSEATSEPYFVWVDGEIADAVKSNKRSFDFDKTAKFGLLSFHFGCILGARYPERVEVMFWADSLTDWQTVIEDSGLSWEGLNEIAQGFLKQHYI